MLNYKEFILYHTNKNQRAGAGERDNTKMRVKLAAKLLIIAWTLMEKKEVYDPALLNRPDKAV